MYKCQIKWIAKVKISLENTCILNECFISDVPKWGGIGLRVACGLRTSLVTFLFTTFLTIPGLELLIFHDFPFTGDFEFDEKIPCTGDFEFAALKSFSQVSREKSRGRMKKRRAYLFRVITLSFL